MRETIMAVLIDGRSTAAPAVQEILTKYGEIIKLRLGLHEVQSEDQNGHIMLWLRDNPEKITNLSNELSGLNLVRVKSMTLD